jgi:hypothetical protein
LIWLLLFEAFLIALHVLSLVTGRPSLESLFNLNGEQNLPTWFSSIQLFLIALTLFSIKAPAARYPRDKRLQVRLVAAGFVFLSMDEFIALHERITARAGSMDWVPTFNTHGAWILPYVIIGLLLAWYCRMALVWAWQLEAKAVLLALGGAVLFAIGAVGLELLGYFIDQASTIYEIEIILEEWLEMIGASLILYAALSLKQALETEPMADY